jgi:hypothetical protein
MRLPDFSEAMQQPTPEMNPDLGSSDLTDILTTDLRACGGASMWNRCAGVSETDRKRRAFNGWVSRAMTSDLGCGTSL